MTTRKQAEAEMLRALERERELGRLKTAFISMVSHEFRTPLNVIAGSSDILTRYLDRLSADERTEHLASIQKSVQRMAGMMEDVLLLGSLEAGRQKFQPQEIHLAAWCRRFLDEMQSATSARCPLELKLADFEPLVRADEALLRHILANLVTNAAKYSPPGAPVTISVSRDGPDAVFQIADHGIGIPAADRARLF
ncbi:MAG: HAMP domain-containing sensor histidine kinase, partial [Chthoniobacteraceae bacterium]